MRLIDADALMRDIEQYHLSNGKFQYWVELQSTVGAVPYEYIIQYGCTCDDSAAKALLDLIDTWESDSPAWKPKFNVVRMKGQKNETD